MMTEWLFVSQFPMTVMLEERRLGGDWSLPDSHCDYKFWAEVIAFVVSGV
jgi:hypothetical protein